MAGSAAESSVSGGVWGDGEGELSPSASLQRDPRLGQGDGSVSKARPPRCSQNGGFLFSCVSQAVTGLRVSSLTVCLGASVLRLFLGDWEGAPLSRAEACELGSRRFVCKS